MTEFVSQLRLRTNHFVDHHAQLVRVAKLVFLTVLVGFFIFYRGFLTPDVLFVLLLVVFLMYGMAVDFVKKFTPFLVLLVTYDAMRGLIPYVSKHVHFTMMINFDRWIGFGQLPTVTLQHWLYHGYLMWYDFYFYGLYMLHFLTPVLVGVLIWQTRPKAYWRYMWSFIVLSYAGFVTYFVYPAAPPWMASEQGLIPTIRKISTDVWWAFGVHDFPSLYRKFAPNPVAAVPSLHAAYPFLIVLYVWKLYGWKWGLPAMLYPLSIWFGVVYLGEHYVFDVLLGILYAAVAFIAVEWFFRWHDTRQAQRPHRQKNSTQALNKSGLKN